MSQDHINQVLDQANLSSLQRRIIKDTLNYKYEDVLKAVLGHSDFSKDEINKVLDLVNERYSDMHFRHLL